MNHMVVKMEGGSALAKHCALSFITSAYAGTGAAGHGLPSDVPWSAIFRLASAESCLATLCDCILSKDIPQRGEFSDLLRLFRDKEHERNAQIASVLDETLTRLASRGVAAIPLKGAAFLASGSGSRSMADIDLLVRPPEKKKAFEALISEGYELATQGNWYESINHHHAPPLLDPSRAIAIELHTRLAPHFDKGPISADVIFSNAQGGFIGNSTVSIPNDTYRIVHLIIHSMIADNGYWLTKIRLRDLIDLLEIQQAGRIDWQALQTIFADIGYEGRAAGFLLASELLLFPAFQAPEWTVSSRRWAERAVQAFFDPHLFRGRRAVGQFFADIEAIVQNPRRLRIVLLPDRFKQFVAARCLPLVNRKR